MTDTTPQRRPRRRPKTQQAEPSRAFQEAAAYRETSRILGRIQKEREQANEPPAHRQGRRHRSGHAAGVRRMKRQKPRQLPLREHMRLEAGRGVDLAIKWLQNKGVSLQKKD